jgi:ribosome-associated toxin RatA of RatAB toxin-antitoxin module
VSQSFTTKNILIPNNSIRIGLKDGPFKQLEGEWTFSSLKKGVVNGCKIQLVLDYEFSNKITATLLGGVFNPIANMMVDSFVKRAYDLYQDKK